MTANQAEQIAKLLNSQNQLTRKYNQETILKGKERFILKEDIEGTVLGAVEVVKAQWYQAEIKHLTVALSQRRRGVGRDLLIQAYSHFHESK